MLRAELLKLRSTRAPWIVAAIALAGMVLVQCFTIVLPRVVDRLDTLGSAPDGDLSADIAGLADVTAPTFQLGVLDLLGSGSAGSASTGATAVCMLLLGVLAATTDFRTGGIVPTALVQPSRTRILAGKAGATAVAAVAVGLCLAVLTALGLFVAIATHADAELALSATDVLGVWGRGLVVLVLLGWLGLGIGTLVRHQVAAVAVALSLTLVEPVVRLVAMLVTGSWDATTWLPLGLGNQASLGQGGALAALVGLAAWALLLAGGALVALRRRDLA